MQAWCSNRAFDTVIHKCVVFLEDLLQEMVDKKSKDPFINWVGGQALAGS